MKFFTRYLLIPAIILWPSIKVFAQAGLDKNPIYEIELVIFKNKGDTGEIWPDSLDIPERPQISGVLFSNTEASTVARLPDKDKQLSAIAYSLNRKGYRLLLHEAWRQPVNSRVAQDWLSINTPLLTGQVRMVKGRYLHFYPDLTLYDEDLGISYPMKSHRRMRSDELHYIDHPKIGIIIQAKRYLAPEVMPAVEDELIESQDTGAPTSSSQ